MWGDRSHVCSAGVLTSLSCWAQLVYGRCVGGSHVSSVQFVVVGVCGPWQSRGIAGRAAQWMWQCVYPWGSVWSSFCWDGSICFVFSNSLLIAKIKHIPLMVDPQGCLVILVHCLFSAAHMWRMMCDEIWHVQRVCLQAQAGHILNWIG